MDTILPILERCPDDDVEERNRLFMVFYHEMRRWAGILLRSERPGHTLRPTDLLHEAFLRFKLPNDPNYVVRNLVELMRKVLIDHARRHKTKKRNHVRVPLDDVIDSFVEGKTDTITLNDLLDELEQSGERGTEAATALKLSYLGGFTNKEIAVLLDRSEKHVGHLIAFAQSWIRVHSAERIP